MQIHIFFLFTQSLFYNQYELINAKAMVGENVRRAEEGEFPFVVSVKIINNTNPQPENDHGCTGVLVSRKSVLTVAHGVAKVPLRKLEVVVGSIDIRGGQKIPLRRIITYSMWAVNKNLRIEYSENDVAILQLNTEVPHQIRPISFYFLPSINYYGRDVVTAGWGWELNERTRYMDTVGLKVLTKEDCIRRIEALMHRRTNLDDRYICTAAEPFAFLRKGDSGGPLILNGRLIGLNKASSPLPENQFHPGKVNLHIGLKYYEYYILEVISIFNR